MGNVDTISAQIKASIIETFQKMKTELFQSNGTIYERDWDDLSPKYKKYKARKRGSAYPINIFTGELLKKVLEDALYVEADYNNFSDELKLKISVNLDRVSIDYAKAVNETREYISFSKEEKKLLNEAVMDTIKRFYGSGM
jgi:hypothetical protein